MTFPDDYTQLQLEQLQRLEHHHMVWSFALQNSGYVYFSSADGRDGYISPDGKVQWA